MPASQLLQVTQDGHLEAYRHKAVQDPIGQEKTGDQVGQGLGFQGKGVCGPGPGLPCMKEQRQPQAVDLIWHLRVEEGEEAADVIHAVHLARQRNSQVREGRLLEPAKREMEIPGSKVWPLHGSNHA